MPTSSKRSRPSSRSSPDSDIEGWIVTADSTTNPVIWVLDSDELGGQIGLRMLKRGRHRRDGTLVQALRRGDLAPPGNCDAN
jgi:hypothetical protein